MKLKNGMYVRSDKGHIFQYYDHRKTADSNYGFYTEYDEEFDVYHEWDDWGEIDNFYNIVKCSFDLIDLIEVGDYVNGYKVIDIIEPDVCGDENLTDRKIITEEPSYSVYNKTILNIDDVKSLVTKEMFERADIFA